MKRRLSTASFKLSVAPKSGADATVYWLVPSVTQIKRKADGTHLPEYVSCESKAKTGEDSPVSGVRTIKFVFTYKSGSTSAEFIYASRIIVTADMAGISFRLYVGGQKVDEKTVLVVDDGEKGKDGLPGPAGERGRLPFPAGKWNANTTYTATDDITPIVYYEDGKTYYVMRKNGSVTGLNPVEDYGNPAGDPTWIPFENLKAVFTEILMARFAKLASAVFWDDYMFSQHGKDANGNDTKDYSGFDPAKLDQENCPFTPNLMLDLLKGDAAIGGRKIMFNSDGSGHLANKNLIWDEEGNINVLASLSLPYKQIRIPGNDGTVKLDLLKGRYYTVMYEDTFGEKAEIILPKPEKSYNGAEIRIYSGFKVSRMDRNEFTLSIEGGESFFYPGFLPASGKPYKISRLSVYSKEVVLRCISISEDASIWYIQNFSDFTSSDFNPT